VPHDPLPTYGITDGDHESKVRSLSETDRAILGRIAEGDSDAQVADAVFLNLQTVRNHVSGLLRTFDCTNRTQLALAVVHDRYRRADKENNNSPFG
jgi:DNA-binding NarL/FixJ family response regulator